MKMAEDKPIRPFEWINSSEIKTEKHIIDHWKNMMQRMIVTKRRGYLTKNPYLVAVDPYDAPVEEEKPEPIDMTQYIHKDEMVQILLDSRHALFTDKIPSVLEVIEWIEERKKQQL
jgi:hypothetical protein